MNDECRRNDNSRAWRKSNVNAKIPEDHVSPNVGIECSKGGYCAPAKRKIGAVEVRNGDNIAAHVEGGGGPCSFWKVGFETLFLTGEIKRIFV